MRGYTVTLTTLNTVYQLSALITAIDPNARITGWNMILLQADVGNTASTYVAIGHDALSTSNYGMKLGPGVFAPPIGDMAAVDRQNLADIYVLATSAGNKLCVLMWEA